VAKLLLILSTSVHSYWSLRARVVSDFAESFEGGFEVIDPSTRSTGWPWVLARGPFGLRLRARRRSERSESREDDFLGEDVGIGEIIGFFKAFVS
jgi:hypothetical protein